MARMDGDPRIIWAVTDEAERVLQERGTFREHVRALPAPPCDIDACELIYGELVANTVRYARGAVDVQLAVGDDDRVLIVRDRGPGMHVVPWSPSRDPLAESGRGLAIVELLAREVRVDPAPGGGTEVRAVLPIVKPA